MKYIKTFESFINESSQDRISLKDIPGSEAMFDSGYVSNYVKGKNKFFAIVSTENGVVGEIEWGQVDKNKVEIISMFIRKEFRKNKYGRIAFDQFYEVLKKPTIILKVTGQSKGYWMHLGFKLMPGTKDYYQYK